MLALQKMVKFTHQSGKDIMLDVSRVVAVLHEEQKEGTPGVDRLDITNQQVIVNYCAIFIDCRDSGIIVKGTLDDVMSKIGTGASTIPTTAN